MNLGIATNWTQVIAQGESETLEFKKSTGMHKEIIETLCGFANKSGGTVIIGVRDNGMVEGQSVTDDTLSSLANTILANTEPKLYPQLEKVEIEGKSCIVVQMAESPLKPHFAYGRPYTRVGPTTQKLSPAMYEVMLLQKQNGYGFDFQLRKDASWDDIDEKAVYGFAEQANVVRNLNIKLTLTMEEILHSLEYAVSGNLTQAALLLFGKKPSKYFFGQYETKCGVFPNNHSYDVLLDDHEFSGNLIENFNSALSFIYRHIKVGYRINGIQGETNYEFSDKVLREALVNMIAHRDYRRGTKNTIEIRPAWLKFYNPAHLFSPDITIERLYQFHPSRPGNRLIAKAFFMLGHLENWGGGTLRIIQETAYSGKPQPSFSFDGGMFELKLFREN